MQEVQPRLAGRVALVTGAAGRDIGKHTALRLAADGAHVVLTDRSEFRLERMRSELAEHHRVTAIACDLRQRDAIAPLIDTIEREVGRLDILVNNAGVTEFAELTDMTLESWDHLLQVDFTAPWQLTSAAARGMKQRGSGAIVNVTSIASWMGGWGEGLYGALKAGLQSLTRDFAAELGPHGIRCNAVAPGIVQSKWTTDHWDFYGPMQEKTPLRRFPTCDEVANTIAFLASDEAGGITGSVINVSAGFHMNA